LARANGGEITSVQEKFLSPGKMKLFFLTLTSKKKKTEKGEEGVNSHRNPENSLPKGRQPGLERPSGIKAGLIGKKEHGA